MQISIKWTEFGQNFWTFVIQNVDIKFKLTGKHEHTERFNEKIPANKKSKMLKSGKV